MPHGLVARRSSAEIAIALFISLRTATTHISHLCAELRVASGAERRAARIVSWLAASSRSVRL